MKKVKLSLLLALIGCCALGLTACDDKKDDSSSSPTAWENGVDVTLPSVDGITFVTDDILNGQVQMGEEFNFTLDLSEWTGSKTFTLLANGETITADENGEYSLTVTKPTTISFADVTVSFIEAEGFKYVFDHENTVTVPFASELSFSLDVNPYYDATQATVRAGTRMAEPNADGVYTIRPTSDIEVTVLDVVKMQPTCTTGGTSSEDPFRIYTPADWLFIAEQVNMGNVNYVNGYYQLFADLDFKGETIPVIGDATPVGTDGVQTFFGGYFNGGGYTISNFQIQETGTPFVGLFGYVVADLEDANFGIIVDLHVKDFSISAVMNRADQDMLAVGGLIGYGIGANILNCSVENARIEITGNDQYSAFVGGAAGIIQTAFLDFGTYQSRVSSQLAYVSVKNTDVLAHSGILPAAGGIVGYTYVPDYLSTASLINCYADNVFTSGAIHTGGIVGQLGAYSSIFNSYSTGNVTANTDFNDEANWQDYCYAYAGGIAGYAENETAIVNCFSTASLDASAKLSGDKYRNTNGIVAKTDRANTHTPDSIAAYLRNNHYAEGGADGDVDLTNPEYVFKTIGWHDFDWVYEDGATYPAFNYESSYEAGFKLKVVYVGSTRGTAKDYTVAFENYAPMSFAFISEEVALEEYMTGDNGAISYGIFFDEACKNRVPYSYLFAAKEETLYAGFLSYEAVAGDYEMLIASGDTASLTLNADGSFEYTDGGITSGGVYRYNGEYVVFESARFARYFNGGKIENGEIALLDFYSFRADIKDGDLYIYDGTYFTKEKPLVAISEFGFDGEYYLGDKDYAFAKDWTVKVDGAKYTYSLNGNTLTLSNGESGTYTDGAVTLSGNALTETDAFKGEWILSAAENYKLTLDGKGGFELLHFGYDRSENTPVFETYHTLKGSYTVDPATSVATLTAEDNGGVYQAKIDEDGYLCVTMGADLIFGKADGYKGEWLSITDNGTALLRLNGITVDGSGMGEIEYWDGNTYALFYSMEYGRITLYNDAIVFGYLSYNLRTDTLIAYLYDSNQAIIDEQNAYTFYHYDVFNGEWVGELPDLGTVEFNGFGTYNVGLIGMKGTLTVNGEEVDYKLDDDTLSGSFTYKDTVYTISYRPESGSLYVSNGTSGKTYERKDAFTNAKIVDLSGATYSFDGKGNLVDGGKVTVTKAGVSETYGYKIGESSTAVTKNGEAYATITVENNVYVWTVGTEKTCLYLMNSFVGTWAIATEYTTMTLQPMNLIGEMKCTVNGVDSVVVYNSEKGICTYGRKFLIPLKSGDFAISATEMLGSSYQICTKADILFGAKWKKAGFSAASTTTYEFDGLGKSVDSYGSAKRITGSGSTPYTYEYLEEYDVYRMWATIDGSTSIYLIEFCDVTTSGAYVKEDGSAAFLLSSIDELFMAQAVEEATGYTYTFDGKYTYSNADGGKPGTVTVTDKDGKVVTTYKYLLTKRIPALGKIEMTLTAEDGTVYNAVFSTLSLPFSITLELAE